MQLITIGYGLGQGISLFIATNICESIVWRSFSPTTVMTSTGNQFEGAVIALFHLLATKSNKLAALKEAFYRQQLPNLTNLLATGLVFVIVIFFQGFKIDIPVERVDVRGNAGTFPIRLFYTSNMPIILQSALLSNFFFLSQLLWRRFQGNFLISLLGDWQEVQGAYQTHSVPVGGLAYYLSPPGSIAELLKDPLHTIFYLTFVLATCALFSRSWIEVSGTNAREVAKSFQNQRITIKGQRQTNVESHLNKYIPATAALGGLCIGLLSIFADFTGAIGSGTGILMAVTIIYQYFETIAKESESSGSLLSLFQ